MNNRVRTDLGDLLILLVDLMLLILASNTAYYVIYSSSITSLIWQPFVRTIPVMALLYVVMMVAYGLWNPIKLAYSEMLYSVFLTIATLWVTTMGLTFIVRDFAYPRYVFFLGFFLQLLFLSIWRTIVFRILEVEHGKKDLLIIGKDNVRDIAKKTIETFPRLYTLKYIADYRCENLCSYIEDSDVVFLCEEIEGEAKIELVDRLMNMRKSVYVVPRNYEINLLRANVQRIEDKPVVKLHKLELTIEQRFFKRIVDILISVTGLLIFAPVFLFVAYKIRSYDGGPVFYSQERMTRGNKVFSILKFRSMVVDAEKHTGPSLVQDEDDRVTPVGRKIRAARLDELPQLFNILKGDMSFVGPRPERPFFFDQFRKEIPDYKYRTLVKAGLTGYAQVYGSYVSTPHDKAKYDLLYIREYSFLKDIKIILLTLKIIFMKERAGGTKEEKTLEDIIRERKMSITIDLRE